MMTQKDVYQSKAYAQGARFAELLRGGIADKADTFCIDRISTSGHSYILATKLYLRLWRVDKKSVYVWDDDLFILAVGEDVESALADYYKWWVVEYLDYLEVPREERERKRPLGFVHLEKYGPHVTSSNAQS